MWHGATPSLAMEAPLLTVRKVTELSPHAEVSAAAASSGCTLVHSLAV